MPIYEYHCPACRAQFEVLVRRSADVPVRCPTCGKGKPVKAFSSFATLSKSSAMPACASSCAAAGDACAAGGCGGGGCHFGG